MAGLRVLIIDDAQHVVRVLRRVFEEAGFNVSTALNGEDGLALMRKERFEVLITDIDMPKMSGEELCDELATVGPYFPRCLFIVTSLIGTKERSWVERYPWISLVEKPVGPRHLLRLVVRRLAASPEADVTERLESERRAA